MTALSELCKRYSVRTFRIVYEQDWTEEYTVPRRLLVDASLYFKHAVQVAEEKGFDHIVIECTRQDVFEAFVHWILTDKLPDYPSARPSDFNDNEPPAEAAYVWLGAEFCCAVANFVRENGLLMLEEAAQQRFCELGKHITEVEEIKALDDTEAFVNLPGDHFIYIVLAIIKGNAVARGEEGASSLLMKDGKIDDWVVTATRSFEMSPQYPVNVDDALAMLRLDREGLVEVSRTVGLAARANEDRHEKHRSRETEEDEDEQDATDDGDEDAEEPADNEDEASDTACADQDTAMDDGNDMDVANEPEKLKRLDCVSDVTATRAVTASADVRAKRLYKLPRGLRSEQDSHVSRHWRQEHLRYQCLRD